MRDLSLLFVAVLTVAGQPATVGIPSSAPTMPPAPVSSPPSEFKPEDLGSIEGQVFNAVKLCLSSSAKTLLGHESRSASGHRSATLIGAGRSAVLQRRITLAFVSVVCASETSFPLPRHTSSSFLALGETQPCAAVFAAQLGRSAAQG